MVHWWLPEIPVWEKILRSVVVYTFLLVMFRLLGKRQVAQMTAFDLIVLLILSNVLQNAMIGPDNSMIGGLIGGTAVLVLNWLVGRMAFSSRWFERAVEGVPTLLIHDGRIIEQNLRKEHLTHVDLMETLRSQGVFKLAEVRVALLETTGKLSVLRQETEPEPKTKS
jgi:uncharacterized membrane protein YcaP (DUF421 family)